MRKKGRCGAVVHAVCLCLVWSSLERQKRGTDCQKALTHSNSLLCLYEGKREGRRREDGDISIM